MAGDWIKMEMELSDKPEVHYIANALNLDPDAVVGKLFRVWCWFNKHTTDGNAAGVTFSLVDRISGVTGFGEMMSIAGWLEQIDKTLRMPNFDYHTSESAKKRALTAKRVAKSKGNKKESGNAVGNANGNAVVTLDALPREEKRRDKNIQRTSALEKLKNLGVPEQTASDWLAVRKAKRAPLTDTAIDALKREAAKAGLSIADAVSLCAVRSWQGFKAEWAESAKADIGLKPERRLAI